jgi:excisionase family DNA binding protein
LIAADLEIGGVGMSNKQSDLPLPLPGERLVSSSHRLEEMRMKYGIPQGMPFILLDVSETGFLSLSQAAAYLSRSPRWLRRLLPEIRHYRPPGGQLLFRKKDLDTFMERYARDPLAEILSRKKGASDPGEILDRVLANMGLPPRRRKKTASSPTGQL